jgi:hypothetical protein
METDKPAGGAAMEAGDGAAKEDQAGAAGGAEGAGSKAKPEAPQPEPSSYALSNPCRVVPGQARHVSFRAGSRWAGRAARRTRAGCGAGCKLLQHVPRAAACGAVRARGWYALSRSPPRRRWQPVKGAQPLGILVLHDTAPGEEAEYVTSTVAGTQQQQQPAAAAAAPAPAAAEPEPPAPFEFSMDWADGCACVRW